MEPIENLRRSALLKMEFTKKEKAVFNRIVAKYKARNGMIEYWCAEKGIIDGIKWLQENVPISKTWMILSAASHGHLETVKWLVKEGYQSNNYDIAYAAKSGHFEVVQWLVKRDHPWNCDSVIWAHDAGHLEIAEYLKKLKPFAYP